MGLLKHSKSWWINYLQDFLSPKHYLEGNVTVVHGDSEIEIVLAKHIHIKKVYAAVETKGIPVCFGDVNMVGTAKISHNKFIIYSDIKSNIAVIHWLVEYK